MHLKVSNGSAQQFVLCLKVLDYNDNDGNEFCDADWVGAFLEALGDVAVEDEAMLKGITDRIHRYLARDKVHTLWSYPGKSS